MTTVPHKTATFVKKVNGTGDGRVYRLNPPIDAEGGASEYVWVSATVVPFSGPETYIFPCDADGNVTDWLELDGSYRGGLSHADALQNAGYEIES
jgi:hypothetical protein